MDKGSLVSIGLTSYRRPEGLQRVLDGLLGQTHANLEIIVSDNCSESEEVDSVLAACAARDARIRVFNQPFNIGMEPNHTFVLRQARGEFFLWLHDDDAIPDTYIERLLARFSDAPNVQLVGPRTDAYMEGRFWYSFANYSSVGEDTYERLARLIHIGYTNYRLYTHYFLGLYRLSTLRDVMWPDGRCYIRETLSLFIRISERGTLHFADDVKLEKYNQKSDLRKWRERNYVDKPARWRVLGSEMEEYLPLTVNIFRTVWQSDALSLGEKALLSVHSLRTLIGVLIQSSRTPWWKRLLRLPLRALRKLLSLLLRAISLLLRV